MIAIRWEGESIRADVSVPGVGVIELCKFGDEPWYAVRLHLDGSDAEYLAFDDETAQGLSPDVPDSDLARLLDVALGAAENVCDCDGERCGSLREHAVRVHREEKEYADRSLAGRGVDGLHDGRVRGHGAAWAPEVLRLRPAAVTILYCDAGMVDGKKLVTVCGSEGTLLRHSWLPDGERMNRAEIRAAILAARYARETFAYDSLGVILTDAIETVRQMGRPSGPTGPRAYKGSPSRDLIDELRAAMPREWRVAWVPRSWNLANAAVRQAAKL